MEAKLLKLARLTAWLLLVVNAAYIIDEFLKPKTITTSCVEAYQSRLPDEQTLYTVVLDNHAQVEVNNQVILPKPGQAVVAHLTPWFGGLKAVSYDFYDITGTFQEQTIGDPNTPRTMMLIVSGILLLICIVTLTAKFEYAVGTIIFGIILAGVRFWVLK
ncbi:MAG: hypothetical protein ACK5CL_04555 [Sphingomonadales bacterium]